MDTVLTIKIKRDAKGLYRWQARFDGEKKVKGTPVFERSVNALSHAYDMAAGECEVRDTVEAQMEAQKGAE